LISAAEIANAPAALKTLDTNHDGKLSAEECGQGFANNPAENAKIEAELGPEYLERARLAFMRLHPVLAALDADHDGEISASEIQNASTALSALDKNGDGKLTADEIFPDPLANAVAHFMPLTRDGKASKTEWLTKTGGRYNELFEDADRNKDGFVTEEELTNEIRRRVDMNGDGVVTEEELQNAFRSGAFQDRK
jgi:Ca2+-binding EF-hand superfamily protein